MNDILKRYFPIADLIAGTFGKECEAVVHDLEDPEKSVVYVANGTVTGRMEGQSFDHLIRNVLLSRDFKDDKTLNYVFETSDGRRIRSSTLFIRNDTGTVAGALCVNYDMTRYLLMRESLEAFFGEGSVSEATFTAEISEESGDMNVTSILDDIIYGIIGSEDTQHLSRRRCVELVRFMDEKGVFLVKGAVDKVAGIMGVSKVTIYSYIDEAKGKR